MPSTTCDLKELIRSVLADGAHGLTLRTGELPVVYSTQGRRLMEAIYPTHEDITLLLRQLTKSRQLRKLRESGVVRFMNTFEGKFRLVGAARIEKDDIHVELRRMSA